MAFAIVAETEVVLRLRARQALTRAGFWVASCGDAAQLVGMARTVRPALIVTGVMLRSPWDGPRACLQLQAQGLACPVILLGGARQKRPASFPGTWPLLAKPFRGEDLERMALELVGAPSAARRSSGSAR